jgi:hypothetical protein
LSKSRGNILLRTSQGLPYLVISPPQPMDQPCGALPTGTSQARSVDR